MATFEATGTTQVHSLGAWRNSKMACDFKSQTKERKRYFSNIDTLGECR